MTRDEMIEWLRKEVKNHPVKTDEGFFVGTLFGFPIGTEDELMALLFTRQEESQRNPWKLPVRLVGEGKGEER